MKDLTAVKKFYDDIKTEALFDYDALADRFLAHDLFASTPQAYQVDFPFLGPVELSLVAVNLSCPSGDLGRALIAVEDGEVVEVMTKDTTKIGGYKGKIKAEFAMKAHYKDANMIIDKAKGNANVEGYIKGGGVLYILPAFGKNHVAFV